MKQATTRLPLCLAFLAMFLCLSCLRPFPEEDFGCPCGAGHVCVDGVCRASCDGNSGCTGAELCVGGVCVAADAGKDAGGTPEDGARRAGDGSTHPGDLHDQADEDTGATTGEVAGETRLPGSSLLEFYDPYGDDNTYCQGFTNPPDNTQKVDHCNFEMAFNQSRTFKVIYFEEGTPVPSQEIEWELINIEDETGTPMATIDAKSSGTNVEGVGSVNVTTSDILGQFALKATAVSNKLQIPPLYFDIVVLPKQVEPLTVKLKYEGKYGDLAFKVYLFLQDQGGSPKCDDIDPTGSLPVADKASSELSLTQTAKFMGFNSLAPDKPLMFTIIATGYKPGGPVLAFGCDDLEGLVEFAKSRLVTIVLHDDPPRYKGKYQVVNHFDMISALPDGIDDTLNVVIDFFNSPTAGLMEITCILKDQATVLEDLCENFFNDPDDPDINSLTMIGGIVQDVVDAILYSLLEDNVGGDIWFTGKDVGNILRNLKIHSTITLKEEPDATGFIPSETTEEEWHTVSIQWTLGQDCNPLDPDCGLKSFSFNAIGQEVLVASFDARIGGTPQDWQAGEFDKLVIYSHSLDLKYGAFLNFVIEKLMLPMLAGDGSDGLPVIDSYEKFFGSLLGGKDCLQLNNCCAAFSEAIAAQSGDWVKGLMQSGCDVWIPMAAEYLRSSLTGLDADTGDAFTIATKTEVPCTLYDMDNNQVIDTWGKMDPPEMRCLWDVLLKLGGTDVLFDAEFWGGKS